MEDLLASADAAQVAELARPAILQVARNEERRVTRRTERAALASSMQSSTERQAARLQLPRLSFKIPGGEKVAWGKAARDEHRARIAWDRATAGALEGDAQLHERALRLMDERRAALTRSLAGPIFSGAL